MSDPVLPPCGSRVGSSTNSTNSLFFFALSSFRPVRLFDTLSGQSSAAGESGDSSEQILFAKAWFGGRRVWRKGMVCGAPCSQAIDAAETFIAVQSDFVCRKKRATARPAYRPVEHLRPFFHAHALLVDSGFHEVTPFLPPSRPVYATKKARARRERPTSLASPEISAHDCRPTADRQGRPHPPKTAPSPRPPHQPRTGRSPRHQQKGASSRRREARARLLRGARQRQKKPGTEARRCRPSRAGTEMLEIL